MVAMGAAVSVSRLWMKTPRLATARSIPEAEVKNCWRIDFVEKLVLYFANGERYEYVLPIDSDDSCLDIEVDPTAISQVRFLKLAV